MRPSLLPALAAAAALLAGCATAAPPGPQNPEPEDTALPEAFRGIPPAVLASRAVFDLESGDPVRMAQARCVLRAADAADLHAWILRASASPAGSAPRRALLAVLADRAERAEGFGDAEVVGACLDEVLGDVPGRRGTLMAAIRMRALGEAALPALFEEARRGGPRGAAAAGFLRLLGVPDRDLPGVRP